MEEKEPYDRYGWRSSLSEFSNSEPRIVRLQLQQFVEDASPEQIRAWDQSIPWLQRECRELEVRDTAAHEYTAILEYELPRDSRRPDVIVLERGCVAVLELKGTLHASRAALDQAFGYARDLAAYHAACAGRRVTPVLLVRGGGQNAILRDGVYVVGPEGLDSLLEQLSVAGEQVISAQAFLAPDAYAPLPTIVQAARDLFHKRELPMIKRARAATDPALQYISDIAREAARTRTRHLVLLSGVPGSGKTLVGLQLVHAHWLDDLSVPRANGRPSTPAVYLSGNGPLVQVLQDALREGGGGGQTFVQDLKNYVHHYFTIHRQAQPPEHLVVFDEAQRAHDPDRVNRVHRATIDKSEPEILIDICNRIPEWSVLVALIGSGQAIHAGEEGGVPLWRDAVSRSHSAAEWTVHGAPAFAEVFRELPGASHWNPVLSLDTEIRFHLTPKVHQFVAGLLDGHAASGLAALADELHAGGHRFLLTRSLDSARGYLRERYADAKLARYGLVASSKDKWLPSFGVDNSYLATQHVNRRIGPWYNAAPSDSESCCQLEAVATEFSSQGLELDCALLAWGSDLLWAGDEWSIEFSGKNRPPLNDPLTVRKNVYRVLLTRGRDGTVVYVPEDPRMDGTFERLRAAGMREL
jgi:hypothetical protein